MNRREFITLLSGAAAAWPLAARAQQAGKLPTKGFLGADASAFSPWTAHLRELGWIENRNIAIEYCWSEGRTERCGVRTTVWLSTNPSLTNPASADLQSSGALNSGVLVTYRR
jgi:putative ABC transport system substrate-binding protein